VGNLALSETRKNSTWCEFQLVYGKKLNHQKLYDLRKALLSILDEHKIEDFLVLNEPNCVLFRVEVDEKTKESIHGKLKNLAKQSQDAFADAQIGEWNPRDDAKNRILKVAKDLSLQVRGIPEGQGWMIAGREPLNNLWVPDKDDLELKIEEFSVFMTRVVGKFTKAYFQNMPRKIQDRWLLSVLIHLLLNSICLDQIQEKETRDFPYY
jgi:hypothetical protein